MTKQTISAARVPPAAPTSEADPSCEPGTERSSLAGERAEGEGMVAPEPTDANAAAAPSDLKGEGNFRMGRHYGKGVARSAEKGDVEKLAEEAANALDGPEGADLRHAEHAAKHGPGP